MIVLDTNVISELASRNCNPEVNAWVDEFTADELWITSTTVSEVVQGIMSMPEGRSRDEVDVRTGRVIGAFYDKTLSFDANAAVEYGRFVSDRFATGRPIDRADAQIAACCLMAGATLATRNTKDFEDIPGLETVNPWDSGT